MIKQDWKKDEKSVYIASKEPQWIDVEPFQYLTIQGSGEPSSPDFQKAVESLFSLSYALKFAPRKGLVIEGYVDYAVYPLEGLWDINDEAIQKGSWDKSDLIYTLMIRQPAFILDTHIQMIKEKLRDKDLPLDRVKLETIEDGTCLQIHHKGSFDDEPASFMKMEAVLKENGYERKTKVHKEIYLSDFRKTKPEALKTTLRIFIKKC